MDISIKNNVNFYGRCPEIRAGGDVCRIIKSQFPSYSVSKLNKRIDLLHQKGILTGSKYSRTVDWWGDKTALRTYKLNRAIQHFDYKVYLDTIRFIKNTKIADCGQLADLAAFILKLNGYKPAIAYINLSGGQKLDHALCVFNKNNKPIKEITKGTIILDPWLGECDFAPNILKKYKEEYNGYFKIRGLVGPKEPFIYINPEEKLTATLGKVQTKMKSREVEEMRAQYPNLLIRNSKYTKPQNTLQQIFNYIKSFVN